MAAVQANYDVVVPFRRQTTDHPPDDYDRKEIEHGGGGGDNGDMERRVKALEEAMIQVRQDVAVMRSNYATKEDLVGLRGEVKTDISGLQGDLKSTRGDLRAEIANAKNSIIMWVVGTIIVAQVLPALPGIVRGILSAFGQQ